MSDAVVLMVPMAPLGKARPRFDSKRKRTYMPADYQAWRREFGLHCRDARVIRGPFSIRVRFLTRSGKMRSDLDNSVATILDALQDAGVIKNDRACVKLSAAIAKEKRGPLIHIELEEVTG